jgi:hypothetical protein
MDLIVLRSSLADNGLHDKDLDKSVFNDKGSMIPCI